MNMKPTNPKDAIGARKVPLSVVSMPVLAEVGLGMFEGGCKYGPHNYRDAGVRASVYFDATMRHLMAWFEGEDLDPDSSMSHVTKAICSLFVLRDSMIMGNWQDDRPIRPPEGWLRELQVKMDALLEKYPNPVPRFTHADV